MNPAVYYRHSGKFALYSPILLGLALFCIIPILSIIYGFGMVWMPIVYGSIILVFLYGAAVGALVAGAAYLGKVRNMPLIMLTALACALIAEYLGWLFWFFAYSEEGIIIINPVSMAEVAHLLAREGIWSVGSGDGMTPKGIFLEGLWAVEFLIVIGCAVAVPRSLLGECVFCENAGKWTNELLVIEPLKPVHDPEQLKDALEMGNFQRLLALPPIDPKEEVTSYSSINIRYTPDDPDFYVLTLKNITPVVDKNGKVTKKTIIQVKNLFVPPQVYQRFRHLAEKCKEEFAQAAQAAEEEQQAEEEKRKETAGAGPES